MRNISLGDAHRIYMSKDSEEY